MDWILEHWATLRIDFAGNEAFEFNDQVVGWLVGYIKLQSQWVFAFAATAKLRRTLQSYSTSSQSNWALCNFLTEDFQLKTST